MQEKNKETNIFFAGDISKELDEIQKMQASMPLILSMITNTCTDFRTIFCC